MIHTMFIGKDAAEASILQEDESFRENNPWFHGDINRSVAEAILKEQNDEFSEKITLLEKTLNEKETVFYLHIITIFFCILGLIIF